MKKQKEARTSSWLSLFLHLFKNIKNHVLTWFSPEFVSCSSSITSVKKLFTEAVIFS